MVKIKDSLETITLLNGNNSTLVHSRKSTKAKNIAIRINHLKQVELVIPKNVSVTRAKKFLIQKQKWIFSKLSSIKDPEESLLSDQVVIFGVAHKIDYRVSKSNISVKIEAGEVKLSCSIEDIKKVLTEFLKSLFLKEVVKTTELIVKKQGLSFSKIKISDTTTTWGSCSSSKVLSFNWRLVFAPKEIVKYVIAHEVAHLKEMNHSADFWKLVESIDKNYMFAIKWLKEHKTILHSYLR